MFQFSYCTDLESTFLTNIEDNLYIKNTGVTHEISSLLLFGHIEVRQLKNV